MEPNVLFVWRVRVWLLALAVTLSVANQGATGSHKRQVVGSADRVECSVSAGPHAATNGAPNVAQAIAIKDCGQRDGKAVPADL